MVEQGRLVTTGEAARELGVPADLISQWRHRRRVVPAGLLRGRGRGGEQPMYWLEELRPLAEAYHARRADTPKQEV